ncbi:MAG: universal stress protein [Deltaproteobacteria bacterium]|nr:universal stress protein [Deltaproteobacteria bacterium]MBI3295402.1 universal stress protein [Deltaproteobacteria bacterium]
MSPNPTGAISAVTGGPPEEMNEMPPEAIDLGGRPNATQLAHSESRRAISPFQRIAWLVTPFARDTGALHRTANTIRALTQGDDAVEVLPVCATSDLQNRAHPEDFFHGKDFGLSGLQKIRSLPHKGDYAEAAALTLDHFASDVQADLITVSSHTLDSKSHVWTLGFTEILSSLSERPVLSINSAAEVPERFDHVLFATDWAADSRATFEKLVAFAEVAHFRITLFHNKEMTPIEHDAFAAPFLGWGIEKYWESHQEHALGLGREWRKWARERGVEASLAVESISGSLGRAIIEKADTLGCDLIALTKRPHRDRFRNSPLSRVIYRAHCPTLLMGDIRDTALLMRS